MRAVLLLVASLVLAPDAFAETRFLALDVYIDSRAPIAAWQFELSDRDKVMRVAGIENGESEVFARAPFYDREAVAAGRADRIVVADYSLADADKLPAGRTRVATLHLVISGDTEPEFQTKLIAVSTFGGKQVEAEISVEISAGSKS